MAIVVYYDIYITLPTKCMKHDYTNSARSISKMFTVSGQFVVTFIILKQILHLVIF